MIMDRWCRIRYQDEIFFGRAEDGSIALHQGDLLHSPQPAGIRVEPSRVEWLPPVEPRQMFGLWNNFHERMVKEGTRRPDYPLYFVKLPDSLAAHGSTITRPRGYAGDVKFEAELGIVIGQRCENVTPDAADAYILGYCCANDVTASSVLFANPEFPQWCRAKGFPGFTPIGPWIATGLDPDTLRVQAILDGEVRQDYPASDMIFSPREIVAHLSREVVLHPGDVILCGTSVGACAMRPGQRITVRIDGIGDLDNTYLG